MEPPPQRRQQPDNLRRVAVAAGMTWQVIDLSKASVDDLLQVPVLFFSGGGNPLPEPEERAQNWPPISATTSTAAVSFSPTARAAPATSTSPSATHGVGLPGARVSLQAAGRFAPDLDRRPEGPAGPGPLAAGHRLRLPHVRGLCPLRSARRSETVAGVPLGVVAGRAAGQL